MVVTPSAARIAAAFVLLTASHALATELHDPVGRLRMPLDLADAGGTVCALDPEPPHDVPPCEPREGDARRAPSMPLRMPKATHLFTGLVRANGSSAVVDVSRYQSDEPTVAAAMSAVLRVVRAAGGVASEVAPTWVRVGDQIASMATVVTRSHAERTELAVAVYVLHGVGCLYVVQVSAPATSNTARLENALLERVWFDDPRAPDAEPHAGGLWVAFGAGTLGATAVALLLVRRRRRLHRALARDAEYWIHHRKRYSKDHLT